MPEINLDLSQEEIESIKILEDEFFEAQKIEIALKSDKSTIKKTVNKYAVLGSIYRNPEKLQKLIDELEDKLKTLIKDANLNSRAIVASKIKKFVERSERLDRITAGIKKIRKMTAQRARDRLAISLSELSQQHGILKSDIAIFMQKAKLNNWTDKQILERLVRLGEDKQGVVAGFEKEVEKVSIMAVRREHEMAAQDEYLNQGFGKEEKWQWITMVSASGPCPDCQTRAGKVLTYSKWENLGLPGTDNTICNGSCKCHLMPVEIADREFPTVKMFDIDFKKMVLTTASQERLLSSKKAQPK